MRIPDQKFKMHLNSFNYIFTQLAPNIRTHDMQNMYGNQANTQLQLIKADYSTSRKVSEESKTKMFKQLKETWGEEVFNAIIPRANKFLHPIFEFAQKLIESRAEGSKKLTDAESWSLARFMEFKANPDAYLQMRNEQVNITTNSVENQLTSRKLAKYFGKVKLDRNKWASSDHENNEIQKWILANSSKKFLITQQKITQDKNAPNDYDLTEFLKVAPPKKRFKKNKKQPESTTDDATLEMKIPNENASSNVPINFNELEKIIGTLPLENLTNPNNHAQSYEMQSHYFFNKNSIQSTLDVAELIQFNGKIYQFRQENLEDLLKEGLERQNQNEVASTAITPQHSFKLFDSNRKLATNTNVEYKKISHK